MPSGVIRCPPHKNALGVNLKDKFNDLVRLRPHQRVGLMQRFYPFPHPFAIIQVGLSGLVASRLMHFYEIKW